MIKAIDKIKIHQVVKKLSSTLTTLLFFAIAIIFPQFAYAGARPGGDGQDASSLGKITPPQGVKELNTQIGSAGIGIAGQQYIGLFLFITKMVQLMSVIAGLITFFNFLVAGFSYITSEGNPKVHEEVRNRLTYSILGLILIVSAYTITALFSLIFFGRADYILNPDISGPLTP